MFSSLAFVAVLAAAPGFSVAPSSQEPTIWMQCTQIYDDRNTVYEVRISNFFKVPQSQRSLSRWDYAFSEHVVARGHRLGPPGRVPNQGLCDVADPNRVWNNQTSARIVRVDGFNPTGLEVR